VTRCSTAHHGLTRRQNPLTFFARRAPLPTAHGAGAGMDHPFMAASAEGLAARGITTLRYQFPYMESGSKRPDRPAVAHAAMWAAFAAARDLLPGVPLLRAGVVRCTDDL
jgi:predicted alpha/beta-hydrolase family hydrolase